MFCVFTITQPIQLILAKGQWFSTRQFKKKGVQSFIVYYERAYETLFRNEDATQDPYDPYRFLKFNQNSVMFFDMICFSLFNNVFKIACRTMSKARTKNSTTFTTLSHYSLQLKHHYIFSCPLYVSFSKYPNSAISPTPTNPQFQMLFVISLKS